MTLLWVTFESVSYTEMTFANLEEVFTRSNNRSEGSKIPQEHKVAHGRNMGVIQGLYNPDSRSFLFTHKTNRGSSSWRDQEWFPGSLKSSLSASQGAPSDIFLFLKIPTHRQGLGDTWSPEQTVKSYHYKTSIFQKYNLCSVKCFPWKTALLRAIKRWLELMRLALGL